LAFVADLVVVDHRTGTVQLVAVMLNTDTVDAHALLPPPPQHPQRVCGLNLMMLLIADRGRLRMVCRNLFILSMKHKAEP